MAYLTDTFRPAVLDRARAFLETIRAARAKRALYLRTVHELSGLTDRDLDDLGVSRHNIEELARTHAYGA